jgi:uncharacterized damage-inducible protein DinB
VNLHLAMAPELSSILRDMSKSQKGLLSAADSVPAEQWKLPPSKGRWSAAELIAHLIIVERAVLGKADRVAQKSPRRISVLRRIHLPLAFVRKRLVRLSSPIPVPPEMLGDKEAMLAELREVRERSLAFMEETRSRNLAEYYWAHPAIGTLNIYEWLEFIAAHEVRHTKQMQEIAASLPKAIESLQK